MLKQSVYLKEKSSQRREPENNNDRKVEISERSQIAVSRLWGQKKKKITGIKEDKEEEPRFWLDIEGKEEKKQDIILGKQQVWKNLFFFFSP